MDVPDIVNQIEVTPERRSDSRPARGDERSSRGTSRSEYRRALSQSLSRSRRKSRRASTSRGRQRDAEEQRTRESRASEETSARTPETDKKKTRQTDRGQSADRESRAEREPTGSAEGATEKPAKGRRDRSKGSEEETGGSQQQKAEETRTKPADKDGRSEGDSLRPPEGIRLLFDGPAGQVEIVSAESAGEQADAERTLRPPSGLFESAAGESGRTTLTVSFTADAGAAAKPAQVFQADTGGVQALTTPQETSAEQGSGKTEGEQNQAGEAQLKATEIEAVTTETDGDTEKRGDAQGQSSGRENQGNENSGHRSNGGALPPIKPSASQQKRSAGANAKGGDAAHAGRNETQSGTSGGPPPGSESLSPKPPAPASSHGNTGGSHDGHLVGGKTETAHPTAALPAEGAASSSSQAESPPPSAPPALGISAEPGRAAGAGQARYAAPQPLNGRLGINPGEFVDRVAESIRMAQGQGQRLRFRMHPPHLGSLQVDISVHEGALSAHLEVQTSSAQQAILENISMLRDSLARQGTPVDRIHVQLSEPAPEEPQSGPNAWADAQSDNGRGRREDDEPTHRNTDEQTEDSEEEPAAAAPNAGDADQLDIQV